MLLERLGRGLYSRAHGPPWTCAPARLQARLGGVLEPGITPGRTVDQLHVQLRGKEERGSVRGVCACEAEEWPPRAASARAATATGGRRRRGGQRRGGRGRRGASTGARGRPEAVGGGRLAEATVLVCTVARSRACVWLASPRSHRSGQTQRVQQCLARCGRSKEMA